MRLIDADKFKEYIVDGFEQNKDLFTDEQRDFVKVITCGLLKDIDEQPKAFDIDKALKKLYTIIEELGDKLEHYEILEEQGILIELPCKPFEKVWIAHTKSMRVFESSYISNSDILADMEKGLIITKTREEAEAKLKEAGEQNEV